MRVVCVAGGSYKSFYLNWFVNLKQCDLLVFNFNIFYNINSANSLYNSSVVGEILNLSNLKKCVVVAGVFVENKQCIIVCKNNKIQINPAKKATVFSVKKQKFVISTFQHHTKIKNKIIFTASKLKFNSFRFSIQKRYLFIGPNGVDLVCKQKLKRNFNKCSQFSLK